MHRPTVHDLRSAAGDGADAGVGNGNGDLFIAPFGDGASYANGPGIIDNAGHVQWFRSAPAAIWPGGHRLNGQLVFNEEFPAGVNACRAHCEPFRLAGTGRMAHRPGNDPRRCGD